MITIRQIKLLEAEMLRHYAMASIDDTSAAVHAELADAFCSALVIVRHELILNQKNGGTRYAKDCNRETLPLPAVRIHPRKERR